MADALLERLAVLDTCIVSDALDRLALSGVVHGIHRLWPSPCVAGRVATVELAPLDDAATGSVRHLGTRTIEAAGPERVVVVANAGRVEMAGWGGLLSLAANIRGVRGVIVDGACRDVDESEALRFPLFARAAVPSTARGRVVEISSDTAVRIGEVTVAPGDLAIADGSGVVFVAAARAEEVMAVAEELAAREAKLAAELLRGRPVTEVLGSAYERMLARS